MLLFNKPMPFFRTMLGWILVSLLSACTSPYPVGNPQAEVRLIGPVSEPVALEPVANMAVVPVSINGRSGLRFLLDTGATPTVLFLTDKTRALGLAAVREFRPGGVGEGPAPVAQVANGVTLRIGAVEMAKLSVVMLPASALPVLGDERDFLIDGIIGWDLFKRFAVEVDYPGQRMRLFAPGEVPVRPGDTVLPLELRGPDAFATLSLAQQAGAPLTAAHLHLDTGKTGTVSLFIGSSPGIQRPQAAWDVTGYGVQGALRLLDASVARLRLGDVELQDVRASFESERDRYAGRQGRLGHGVLQRFVYTVDLTNQRLILRPLADTTRPRPWGFTGLGVLPQGDAFVVRQVQPGTPAASAGFKPGMRITRIGGQPLAGKTDRRVATMLELEPGQAVEVCVADAPTPCRTLVAADRRRPPAVAP